MHLVEFQSQKHLVVQKARLAVFRHYNDRPPIRMHPNEIRMLNAHFFAVGQQNRKGHKWDRPGELQQPFDMHALILAPQAFLVNWFLQAANLIAFLPS